MKIIDKSIRQRRYLSITIFTVIQLLSLISPYIMGAIIDDYIPNKKINNIVIGIILFLLIPFISVLLQTIYNYFTIKYVRKKGNEFALKIMEILVFQEKTYFDQENSLELLSYASKEAVGYINFYLVELSQYYVSIIIAVITFFILSFLNPILGLFQILYLPFAYFPVQKIMKNVDKEIKTVVQKNAEINQIKGDVFQAIEFIKLYRLEQKKLNEVDQKNKSINSVWGKVAALDTLSGIWISGFVTVLFTGITFGIGTILILLEGDYLQVGQLVSIISYCAVFYSKIAFIFQTTISKKKNESEYSKTFSYLEMTGEREKNAGKKAFELTDKIEFRNCNFTYKETESILHGLNISFQRGQWTGIVGTSGSGKSTIFEIIMKLYPVKDGEVWMDSTDINQIDCFSIREHITKISQNVFLFPGTLEDNLRLVCPEASEKEIQQVLDFACLSRYIETLPNGIKTEVGEAGKRMSGGERQRLSIAMGLLRKNKILLLDEVTSNLDQKIEEELAHNFHRLMKQGYTIISISHRMEFLKYATAIYEVKKGEAVKIK